MKICLSAAPDDLKNARDWVTNPKLKTVLSDLEGAVLRQEKYWGACTIFVECTLPVSGPVHSNQIDLLIAFEDRAAFFELKQARPGNFLHANVRRAVNQINNQFDTLKAHLKRNGFNELCLEPFLWAPRLAKQQLEEVVKQLRHADAARHIAPTGANPAFRGYHLSDGIRAYLPEALVWRLQRWIGNHSTSTSIATFLERLLRKNHSAYDKPWREFLSFSELQTYLSGLIPDHNVELVLDSRHIVRLRPQNSARMIDVLQRGHFAEVIGPSDVGKSNFIKETLIQFLQGRSDLGVCTCIIQKRESPRTVLRTIALVAGFVDAEGADLLDDDAFLTLLGRSQRVYWIKDYDRQSQPAIAQLIRKLQQAAERYDCYWIVESMVSSVGTVAAQEFQIILEPLPHDDIVAILQRFPQQTNRDINAVVAASGGFPGLAVSRWTLDDESELPKSSRLDKYDLFAFHLKKEQRPLVNAIAFMIGESPLGTTIQLLERWCRAVVPGVGDIRRHIRDVLQKACEYRLLTVEVFGVEELGAARIAEVLTQIADGQATPDDLISATFPSSLQEALVGSVHVLDPHFLDYFIRKITPDDKPKWRGRLQEVLLTDLAGNLSLSAVTFSLLTGDMETFLRSAFRQSSSQFPRLATWLDSAEAAVAVDPHTPNGAYFRQWYQWMRQYYWDDVNTRADRDRRAWDIAPPNAAEPVQLLLFRTLQARGANYWDGRDYDWSAWSKAIDEFWKLGEFDLWAEALVRQGRARLGAPYNQVAAAWELMSKALKEETKLTEQAGRPLISFFILDLFNKQKLWKGRVPSIEAAAPRLVPELARKMIHDGLISENVSSIANALFFYMKWIERSSRPKTASEVAAYAVVMEFVVRISPARRVPALITHGSVHRHYCSRGGLTWDEFHEHAEQALKLYQRVVSSTIPARMMTWSADALNYCGDLIVKSLRYGLASNKQTISIDPAIATDQQLDNVAITEQRQWLHSHLGFNLRAVEAFLQVASETTSSSRGDLDRGPVCNLYKYLFLYRWLFAILLNDEVLDLVPHDLRRADHYLRDVLATLNHEDRAKLIQQTLKDFYKVLVFTNAEAGHSRAAELCASAFIEFLTQAGNFIPKGPQARRKSDTRKQGQRIILLLTSTGVNIPPTLRKMFSTEPMIVDA